MDRLEPTKLFGPERVRGAFGVVYEIDERIREYDDGARGRMLEARYRRPGEEAWSVGCFELAKLEELPPRLGEAA